jgi:hypothetical protein
MFFIQVHQLFLLPDSSPVDGIGFCDTTVTNTLHGGVLFATASHMVKGVKAVIRSPANESHGSIVFLLLASPAESDTRPACTARENKFWSDERARVCSSSGTYK